jgi:hypothetical protein
MADPKELEEAANAILRVRRMPAVRRHQQLDGPLRQAEDWAREHYRKVTEQSKDGRPWQPSLSFPRKFL